MDGYRKISGNRIGNNNTFVQGDATFNRPAKRSHRRGENDVLKRLYTSRYQDRKDRNPKRVPGTCDWFVSHEHFQTWNNSKSSAMLWVSADPGCGKSVLVRHLVDAVVPSTESRTVCYFFFKDDFPDQRNIISALSCILRQIFIQKPSLLSNEILKKFNSGGETFTTSFSELWQALMQVAEDKNAGEIVCLLDAIDECENQSGQGRSELLEALCTLYGTELRRNSNIKFLLTSRPYVGIYRSLQPVQIPSLPVIHLSGESEEEIKKISLEINTYIEARVNDIGKRLHLSQVKCDLLLEKLTSVPNRTYLWVYLVLNFIENSVNVNNIMIIEATSNIPRNVNEAYERILSKSFDAEKARKVLHIIVAAARPLTLEEMNFALALDGGDRQSYDDLDLLPDDRFRESLRNICGLCVVVVDSRVYLLHQTVKEFLVKVDDTQAMGRDCGDHKWKFSLEPQVSQRVLAKICIRHLRDGLKMTSGSPTLHNWQRAFLDYSAKHWASHFRQTTIETQSMMNESILGICDVHSHCCQTWFRSYWTTTNTEFPGGFTTLMMASYFGLHFAVGSLLTTSDIGLDTKDDTYHRSALSWAARNGYHIVARLLLKGTHHKLSTIKLPFKKRAKVDLQDKYGRAPLTYAVWNGNVTLVQLLIKAGAQADLRDELDGTPLSYAFCNGNVQIIDLLAKKKREVDIENNINQLLLSATQQGHEEVMSLLLKTNRANIEVRDPSGRTPLILAARVCHEATVRLLLEAGADVNARNKDGKTPLIVAAEEHQSAIVKLLLEAGADVNARNKNGETPLLIAAGVCHEATVKLLLEAGADVNARDEDGETPLYIAAGVRDKAIVKLLLEAGADVNARNKDGKTPLLIAVRVCHEATVKLLLEAGADVNARDMNDKTALDSARGLLRSMRVIQVGVHINPPNELRREPSAVLKLLLEAGAFNH